MSEKILKKETIYPGKKTIIVGEFDDKTQPIIELRISPKHKEHLLEYEPIKVGTKEKYTLKYKVHNQNSNMIFVEIIEIE